MLSSVALYDEIRNASCGLKDRRAGGRDLLQQQDVAPGFRLSTVSGQPVSLGDTLQEGRNVLLVFLRHLG